MLWVRKKSYGKTDIEQGLYEGLRMLSLVLKLFLLFLHFWLTASLAMVIKSLRVLFLFMMSRCSQLIKKQWFICITHLALSNLTPLFNTTPDSYWRMNMAGWSFISGIFSSIQILSVSWCFPCSVKYRLQCIVWCIVANIQYGFKDLLIPVGSLHEYLCLPPSCLNFKFFNFAVLLFLLQQISVESKFCPSTLMNQCHNYAGRSGKGNYPYLFRWATDTILAPGSAIPGRPASLISPASLPPKPDQGNEWFQNRGYVHSAQKTMCRQSGRFYL